MKKLAAVALLAALALGSACSSNSNGNKTPIILTPTTSHSSGPSKALCDSTASQIGSLFTQYAALLPQVSTQVEVNQAVSTGRALVSAGRTFVSSCGHYYDSARIQGISDNLDTVENGLNSAGN